VLGLQVFATMSSEGAIIHLYQSVGYMNVHICAFYFMLIISIEVTITKHKNEGKYFKKHNNE
jgi:hypothetical protein